MNKSYSTGARAIDECLSQYTRSHSGSRVMIQRLIHLKTDHPNEGFDVMKKKRDFSDFSIEEIDELARQAGEEARQESLEKGLEILYKDLDTGEFYFDKLDENGNLVRRYVSREDVIKELDLEHLRHLLPDDD